MHRIYLNDEGDSRISLLERKVKIDDEKIQELTKQNMFKRLELESAKELITHLKNYGDSISEQLTTKLKECTVMDKELTAFKDAA